MQKLLNIVLLSLSVAPERTVVLVEAFLNRGYATYDTTQMRPKTNFLPTNDKVNKPTKKEVDSSLFVSKGVLDLDFNPAFISFAHMNDYGPVLVVSSFFNVALNPAFAASISGQQGDGNSSLATPIPPYFPFYRDVVALVDLSDDELTAQADNENQEGGTPQIVEVSDVTGRFPFNTVWPNICERVPDGVFPFEAIASPQGWFAVPQPGRLVVINVETKEEYIIHQSTPAAPRFYHRALFHDMDRDGHIDIVTVRSGYKVMPTFSPPAGELVWFRNPGPDALQANVPWEEHILVQGAGPDVSLDLYDLEGDGVPEIVATHIFAGLPSFENSPWASPSRLTLFGAPTGKTWADVDGSNSSSLRVADILTDHGLIFNCEFVDLDQDGRMDVLATNHQTLVSDIPGRVFAVEQPASGNIFEDDWVTHIILDGIWPNKQPMGQPQRMAPGSARSFSPGRSDVNEEETRPWIVVSGDEDGRVWVLKPVGSPSSKYSFDPHIVFDINDYYGAGTTQAILQDPFGITISTIGDVGIREDPDGTYLYVPVFEATDVHVLRFDPTIPVEKDDEDPENDTDENGFLPVKGDEDLDGSDAAEHCFSNLLLPVLVGVVARTVFSV